MLPVETIQDLLLLSRYGFAQTNQIDMFSLSNIILVRTIVLSLKVETIIFLPPYLGHAYIKRFYQQNIRLCPAEISLPFHQQPFVVLNR